MSKSPSGAGGSRPIEIVLSELRNIVRRNLGREPVVLVIRFEGGQTYRTPFPIACPEPPPAAVPEPIAEPEPWAPSAFQEAILEALDGQALRARALGAAVGDQSRLYRAGGLAELRERGLVRLHERLGYYRPDAPPPGLGDG